MSDGETDVRWYARDADAVAEAFDVDLEVGLPEDDVPARRQTHGPNRLRTSAGPTWVQLLVRQFADALVLLLLVAAVVSFVVGEPVDALTILGILVLNAALGFVQEFRAEKALAALQDMLSPRARVRRGGQVTEIDAEDLVPGDVVILGSGDRVPADLRLVSGEGLRVDESALTGESTTVAKHARSVVPETPLAERTSMVWMGTGVARGSAAGVVVGTGAATEIGRVVDLTAGVHREPTPLQRRLGQLGRQIGVLGLVVAAGVSLAGWLAGEPLLAMFLTGVALAVAVVPEGLPAVVTITLGLGVERMMRRRALLRRLQAAETLGSATVICSDKTGTLTRNEMTVVKVWTPDATWEVSGVGYAPEGEVRGPDGPVDPSLPAVRDVLATGLRCTHAELAEQEGRWVPLGEPTEVALLTLALKAGLTPSSVALPVRAEHPFDADRKRMTVVVATDGGHVAYVKGAPERLLERSSWWRRAGGDALLDETARETVTAAVDAFAADGLRTLALATRRLPDDLDPSDASVEEELVLLAVAGILDPPRATVPGAIATARRAGIRTMVITGDAAGTAVAIARRVGLPGSPVVTGPELEAVDDEGLKDLVVGEPVFARTTPEHKLRIIHALQARGEVVAMTGDGVNDAPALKQADIGVAMGERGTEVARASADMILLDDDYASIVGAVEEGRRQYDAIETFVRYLLTSNTGEVLAIVGQMVLGGPLLLLPVQILWMNLVTDGVTAVALGVEPAQPGLMTRRPRRADQRIVDGRALGQILLFGAWLAAGSLVLYRLGDDPEHARTMAFVGLVILQKVNVWNFRSLRQPMSQIGWLTNPWLLAAWAGTVGLMVVAVYWPPLQALLHIVPLGLADWGWIALVSLPVFVVVELWKVARARAQGIQGT